MGSHDAEEELQIRVMELEAEVKELRCALEDARHVIAQQGAEVERLRAALDAIGGGHTDRFPGGPDVMKGTPEEFRLGMWTWSQKVAREALKGGE